MVFDDFDTQPSYEERVQEEREYLDALERENNMRAIDQHKNEHDGHQVKGWY